VHDIEGQLTIVDSPHIMPNFVRSARILRAVRGPSLAAKGLPAGMPANRTQGCVLLLAATDYQATIQITWRQLNDDAIPGKKSSPVPHLARDIRQNLVLVFHYHTKPSLR